MAYATSNPPVKVSAGTGLSPQVWIYSAGADAVATVRGAGYITNAKDLGMRVGDVVISIDTTTPLVSLSRVSVVSTSGSTMTA